jgi:hypothetical protein
MSSTAASARLSFGVGCIVGVSRAHDTPFCREVLASHLRNISKGSSRKGITVPVDHLCYSISRIEAETKTASPLDTFMGCLAYQE